MRPGRLLWSLRHAIAHSGLDRDDRRQAGIDRDAVDAIQAAAVDAAPWERRAALGALCAIYGFDAPHEVFNALRDIVISAEYSRTPEVAIQATRDAYAEACRLFGEPMPPEGDDGGHRPRRAAA
ncbi:MAG: hypothetical protein BGO82_17040 [Devosia sp. 67-54]|uniref:hypothetical protein n=1 Tax=unclassified Devosia TaxID=196773 RepID=UPI000968E714|nr:MULTISPECIES: hypothetical protein [unclassified Devosia]MBN9304079.1 hypothetical protein [Devosia sp.]OJX17916.1 MAG: hypothetical protein BGO82_17040 [Devosia sp. 67-54]